jgi:hypothetical protein
MPMKNLSFMKLLFLSSSLFLISVTTYANNYQTECVSLETDGYVTIKIWDTKKGKTYTTQQARKDAVAAILYSGVSSTNGCITQPPILNKAEEQQNFKSIEKKFFSKNGKWIVFTRSSAVETTLPNSLGEKKWKVYQVSVSREELRIYLEEQKVIKALNTGF